MVTAFLEEIELEDYVIQEQIGRGDLTIVYRARRKSDEAAVAIKLVAPQFTFDQTFVRRFKETARQSAKLEHPNIVRTYEARQEGSVLYVVRELIDAPTLAEVLETEGPLSPQRMLTIARQVAAALDYAHQKSVTHGDLSANRIYVELNDRVMVADFGQVQAMAGTSLAKQGYAVGSPETIAPERVHGQGPSRQSDLYSLGILCYQMLVGQPPFIGTPAAVLHAQAYEQPQPLHLVNPSISIPLSEAISRMLSKGLELRYNTGAEFARALAVAAQGTAPVRSLATAAQIKEAGLETPPLWQRPWLLGPIAAFIIILLIAVGFWVVSAWNAFRPAVLPTIEVVVQPTDSPAPPTPTTIQTKEAEISDQAVVNIEPPVTSTPSPTVVPTSTPTPTATPTLVSLPTPGPPTIAEGSPFTNLKLAHKVGENDQPEDIGISFAPGPQPVYLFFDYEGIEPGTLWTHRWTWADTELGTYQETWPDSFSDSGTAWVYYNPSGSGYQPGPYKVTLEVNGRIVATATFVIESGGL